MRITRISRVRNYRIFRDFEWPPELLPFAQFNVIYGWNGSGKSTLASLFAQLESRRGITDGDVQFEVDESRTVRGTELATENLPQVRVFNRDFIDRTLHASTTRPIYYLGAQSAQKQRELERLRKELGTAVEEVEKRKERARQTERALEDFLTRTAKSIRESFQGASTAAYQNYDKRKLKAALQALDERRAAELAREERIAGLKQAITAEPKPEVALPEPAIPDFDRLRARVDALVRKTVVSRVLSDLKRDPEVQAWAAEGLALHSGARHSDRCLFCCQEFRLERRAELEAHFSNAFAAFQSELGEMEDHLNRAKADLTIDTPHDAQLYRDLRAAFIEKADTIGRGVENARAYLDELVNSIRAKQRDVFTVVSLSERAPPLTPPTRGELQAAFAELSEVVALHNQRTQSFSSIQERVGSQFEQAQVARSLPEYADLSGKAAEAKRKLHEASSRPGEVQEQIDALERELVDHRLPADELNTDLRSYLGRDELRFTVQETGYSLTRGGHPVSHLSEGERPAIAFLYFLKTLQDRSFELKKSVVVIDDPVSSLDATAMFSAFAFMRERTKECGQLIVLTHSFSFFRQVKNWFHHLKGQRSDKPERRPGRFFYLFATTDGAGRRSSLLARLDPLLEEYESEYHFLFQHVHREANRLSGEATLAHHYGMPNVARRLLEAFLAFRLPAINGDLSKRLDQLPFDAAKRLRILRFVHRYSHGDAIAGLDEDPSGLAETQPVLRDLLELMKATDPSHYEGLEQLMRPRAED